MSKAEVERLATAPVPFRAVIETARRLDELSTARIVSDIAEAVHKAQTGGKPIHRLTPDAIVIASNGEPALSLPATEGPLAYASPERVKGMSGDRRSDVFSLGVVLWEALAHTRLFEGKTDDAVKRDILERDIRPPSEKNANVPAELDAICKKALARDPADRYQSAKVMAAEISAVLDDAGYPDDHSRIAKFVTELPTSAKSTMPGIGAISDSKPTAVPKESSKPESGSKRNKSPTGGGKSDRTKTPTGAPGAPKTGDRPKSPTNQPLDARAKSPTNQPLGDRAKSPTSPSSLADRLAAAPTGRTKEPTTPPASSHATLAGIGTTPNGAAPSDDPGKTAILGSGSIDEKTALASVKWHDNTPLPKPEAPAPLVPAAPIVPAAPVVAKAALPGPSRARSASRPPPTEPTVAASPEILATATGSQPLKAPAAQSATPAAVGAHSATPAATVGAQSATPAAVGAPSHAAAPTPLVRVGSAPVTKPAQNGAATTQNGAAVATPVDATGSGATKAAGSAGDLPEAANAVTLPRASTKGDVLQGWGWGTDSHTAINPIEDDDDESMYAAERAKQRKRLFMAIGGVAGAIVLVVLIALAFSGGGKSDDKAAAKPASGAIPAAGSSEVAKQEPAEPAVVKPEEPKPEEPKPEEPKPEEPKPEPAVAKAEPKPEPKKEEPKPEPKKEEPKPEPKKEVAKKEEPKKAEPKKDPPKKEVAKKDPPKKDPPKKEVAKKDPKPVDPYATTKIDAATAYRTGLQQFAKGDNKGALETFRASLTTNQSHAPTWRGIGLVYEKLGKKAQAKIAFKKYLQLSPNASDADQIKERLGRL